MSILKYVSCCCHDIYNGCFRVFCPMFLHRRAKIRIFTLIELLMRKSCKSGISFRQQHCRQNRDDRYHDEELYQGENPYFPPAK